VTNAPIVACFREADVSAAGLAARPPAFRTPCVKCNATLVVSPAMYKAVQEVDGPVRYACPDCAAGLIDGPTLLLTIGRTPRKDPQAN